MERVSHASEKNVAIVAIVATPMLVGVRSCHQQILDIRFGDKSRPAPAEAEKEKKIFEPISRGQLAKLNNLRGFQRIGLPASGEEGPPRSVVGRELLKVGDLRGSVPKGPAY